MDSLHLFNIAKLSCERASEGTSSLQRGQSDSIVALFFAAATLEAFINELAEQGHNSQSDEMQRIAGILDELEENRVQLGAKFLVLSQLLGGEVFRKDCQPYQDFQLLIETRNRIAHKKVEHLSFEPDKIVTRFSQRGLCKISPPTGPLSLDHLSHWLGDIATPAAARWACNVVARMVKTIGDHLSDDAVEIRSICPNYSEVPER